MSTPSWSISQRDNRSTRSSDATGRSSSFTSATRGAASAPDDGWLLHDPMRGAANERATARAMRMKRWAGVSAGPDGRERQPRSTRRANQHESNAFLAMSAQAYLVDPRGEGQAQEGASPELDVVDEDRFARSRLDVEKTL